MKVSGPVVLASRNRGKLAELRELVGGALTLVSFPATLAMPEVEETEETYLGNALLKARAVSAATGGWALADDSGLEVDAVGGVPGVRSARFGGEGLDDRGRCRVLLDALVAAGAEAGGRRARFRCVLALVRGDECVAAEGVLEGEIALAPRGAYGFGYDPIFVPPGFGGRTFAELDAATKNRISHRARAARGLLEKLAGRSIDSPEHEP